VDLQEAQSVLLSFPKVTPERLTKLLDKLHGSQEDSLLTILEISQEVGGCFWYCSVDERQELADILLKALLTSGGIPVMFALAAIRNMLLADIRLHNAGPVVISYELFPDIPKLNEELID